ncbi:hypothetical protein FVR03_13400 [Pontibacter qinzhouensis]|uniref:Uncharacterized protein n=1 Tax=Pontibacter qinzhouensis TaxID=2603253 RepID=A0A5C8K6A5_9BACT|nr:hypothetical protein [Pontibacter qinzhouensis]TXK44633.1 hypothetical protein FVR03_13400 [Pontibacter qinzhouensis]
MILSPLLFQKSTKLYFPTRMPCSRLIDGEQYLIQTVDKKLALTTHRVIQTRKPWDLRGSNSIMLEDISNWEIKTTGKALYLGLSIAAALMVYFNDSFALVSGFFLMLYMMTRYRRVHILSEKTTMVLPLDVEESQLEKLIEMVRQAKKARLSVINHQAQQS